MVSDALLSMTTPLRKNREKIGVTASFVAAAVGVNQSQYTRVENGTRRASPALAKRIELFFKGAVTRDEILFPEEHKSRASRLIKKAS